MGMTAEKTPSSYHIAEWALPDPDRTEKQERINGALQGEQTIRTTIQEDPSAIRLEYLKGPSAGRKLIYNSTVKKKNSSGIRVTTREPGKMTM